MVDKTGARARRPRADALRNRDLVLSTALEMLSAGGLAVSFDEIARRAGVGVGTVYRHFPTRDALYGAVILDRIEQFTEHGRKLAEEASGDSAFLDYFAYLVDKVALNQALCDTLGADGKAAAVYPATARHEFVGVFGGLLEHAQRAGAVRPDLDIADAVDLLVGAATAQRHARRRGASDQVLGVVLDGLRRRPDVEN